MEGNSTNTRHTAPGYAGSLAPPRYSTIFGDPEDVLPVGAPPTQHESVLFSGVFKRKRLATLHVFSRPSNAAQKYPLYFGGENVAGSIELKLDTPQIINSISILLRGQLVSSFSEGGYYTFLVHTENVWNKIEGDPRASTSAAGESSFNGKLSGDLQFSFSFPFPLTVDLSTLSSNKAKGPGIPYQTPQTFLEHQVTTNIEYELVLLINHGGLRPDSKVKARIRYIPKIVPDPLSGLQQLSYRENRSLSGPDVDSDGWHALPPIPITGVLQDNKNVSLQYRLYLAKPLSYTRGAVIPCYLIISSEDSRSLEILSSTKLQNVRLVRCIRYFQAPGKAIDQLIGGKNPEFVETVTQAGHAVWWIPPKDVPQEPCLKRLQGEIHLPKELAPSSDFLPLSIEYFLEVLPFFTDVFMISPLPNYQTQNKGPRNQERVLLSYRVTIATFKANGPSPRPFSECPLRSKADFEGFNEQEDFKSMSEFGLWNGPYQLVSQPNINGSLDRT